MSTSLANWEEPRKPFLPSKADRKAEEAARDIVRAAKVKATKMEVDDALAMRKITKVCGLIDYQRAEVDGDEVKHLLTIGIVTNFARAQGKTDPPPENGILEWK